ncbi:MAG: shikimate dehydrogenase [Bacteroidota bacterium]
MRNFGLIGFPLSHSFSKKFFTAKFKAEGIESCEYNLYPIEDISYVSDLIKKNSFLEGLNVTIPYKLDVLSLLNSIDEAARDIGAVNCIKITRTGNEVTLKGYNTDAYGFEESLKPLLTLAHTKALILGDGGAAKAVKYVLNKLEIPFIVASRKASESSILYDEISDKVIDDCKIIINTTPLGMSPEVASYPDLPYAKLSTAHLAYDLVYNPDETAFLNKARVNGATTKNGLEMLYMQAERSWYLWNK